MSKTFRYDPESDDRFETRLERRAARRVRRAECGDAGLEIQDVKPKREPDEITLEWALKRMSRRMNSAVESLVSSGLIDAGEREDYLSILKCHLAKVVPQYSAERTGKDGRTSSAVHFLWRSIDTCMTTARRYLMRKCRRRDLLVRFASDDGEEAQPGVELVPSDICDGRCRSVRDVDLRMDLETLYAMLRPDERLCLAMRLEGYTDMEIAERLADGSDRFHVQKVLMKHVQEKARECGFFPASESRGRK